MNQENNQENRHAEEYYPRQSHCKEDVIDLRELIAVIWKAKWLILSVTFLLAIGSILFALSIPNEYKATAIVQPNDRSNGDKLASLAGQFGGLASFAGINMGPGQSSDAVIAVEIMKSWGFIEKFIFKHDLSIALMAANGWDKPTNTLKLNEDIYNSKQKEWIKDEAHGENNAPTSWELYKSFRERMSIIQDKETGLISISVNHYSPYVAKQWADLIVEEINLHMKSRALEEANKSIRYLEEQISKTSVAEIRTIFSELIQEQHKTKMLAQVSDEYVFNTISEAKVPEEKFKPKRAIIVLVVIFLGGLLSIIFVILQQMLKKG